MTDPLLEGKNPRTHLLAVHQNGEGNMLVYARTESGVTSEEHEFYPFFFLSDGTYLDGFQSKYWIKELAGTNYFRFLCAFPSWSAMWDAIHYLIRKYSADTRTEITSYNELPILHFRPDPTTQFLMQTGMTLFKGMEFGDLHRLQLDIETYTAHGYSFSNANREEDRIIIIALSDNRGWHHVISGERLSERQMLTELVAVIRERDPDVIEGHNIFNFDLPYILKRCEFCNVDLAIGRDGSLPRSFDTRTSFADRMIEYMRFEIGGRHIIDTLHLLQSYDSTRRTLESYGLKYAARHFGFSKEDRIYVKPERISWTWDNERDLLVRYALDDVEETRLLNDMLLPTSFYLTQLLPFNLGTTAHIGASAKIETLLLREYMRQRHSIPRPDTGVQTTGGYTDIFFTGILGPIIDADIESLYPSIMLTGSIAPKYDALSVFLPLLRILTEKRLEAKRLMQASTEGAERSRLDAMQSSLKILINSFYGYLGYSRALFSDAAAADNVTLTGQRILRELMKTISAKKGTVVEVDTDGIFFVPPPFVKSDHDEREYLRQVGSTLPPGIHLAMKGRYRSILSYKKKNYALRGYDEKITIRGSSLTSRNIEIFGRNFIQQCIEMLLNDNIDGLHTIYVNLHNDIRDHKLTISDFARTETLKEIYAEYAASVEQGERNRTAVYEVAIASGLTWKRGDRVSYYITGSESTVRSFEYGKLADDWNQDFPDENSSYYLKRLDEFASKFDVFFSSADFQAIFSVDDLFGFSSAGRTIRMLKIEQEEKEGEPSEKEVNEPTIWLDLSDL